MTRISSLKAVLVAGVCLLPITALAQSDDSGFDVGEKPAAATAPAAAPSNNWINLGGQYQSGKSYYLNQYTGAVNPGWYGLGDFHYGLRDPWESGGTHYLDLEGSDLGMWDRSFNAAVGQQGTWGLTFSYEGIPFYATDPFLSIYQPNGKLVGGNVPGGLGVTFNQLLPRNGAVNSLWMPKATSNPTLSIYDNNTQRNIYTGGGKFRWGDWTINVGVEYTHKEGYFANSMVLGGAPAVTSNGSGANKPTAFTSALVYFPQPIDYDYERYMVTASYGTSHIQALLNYTFSQFLDNSTTFTGQNPFSFFSPTLGNSFAGPVSAVTGIYALPPSNMAHQLKAEFGMNITPTTRLNANFGYSLATQNEPFQQGIGNGTVSNTQNLPRSSLDGLMQSFFGNVALTAEPLPRLDLRIAYTIDDRDNETPRNLYSVYPTSTTNTNFQYYNLPFSYRHQIGTLEAGYRIAPQTKVTLTDTLDSTWRDYTDTSWVGSETIAAKIRGPVIAGAYGSLTASYMDRWVNNYNSQGWWQATCAGCNVEPGNFVMYFEAPLKREQIKGMLDWSPTEKVSASLIAAFNNDNYTNVTYGLRNNYNLSIGPDVSWQPSQAVSTHLYYTYQQIYYSQSSIYQSPGAPSVPAPSPTNSQYSVPWTANTTNAVHTIGASVSWQAIPNLLKIGVDYNLSYGDTAYALGEGVVAYGGAITSPTTLPAINMQPLPDVTSLLSVISVHGEYTLSPKIRLFMGYAWERFTYKDFMVGIPATQYANALLPGALAPNESVHVVSAGLHMAF